MSDKISAITFTILFVTLLGSCQQKKTEEDKMLPVKMDDSSRVIIDRAIAHAGDFDAWQNKKTLSFDKKSISYDSAGNITRQVDQHFDYMMKPEFRAKVSYKLGDTDITLIHDGQKAAKLYNGIESNQQKDIDGAWNSCFGSQYVMCMPYKLKDPGIKAEYLGQVTLSDGVPAQLVKTSYVKGAGSNPDHIWYYYFEPGTGKLLANSFQGKNNYWDYTRYEKFEKVDGLLMPAVRIGYTADTLNKPDKLISKSEQFNIVFDKNLPADHFKIPHGR